MGFGERRNGWRSWSATTRLAALGLVSAAAGMGLIGLAPRLGHHDSDSQLAVKGAFFGQVVQLRMVSPSAGWAMTSWGLVRTTDGARQWFVVTPPSFPGRRGVLGSSLFALNASRAWLASVKGGGNGAASHVTVWRTTSGGHRWRSAILAVGAKTSPLAAASLDFVSPTGGWLEVWATCRCRPALGPSAVALFRTRDSGATWRKAPTPPQGLDVLAFQSDNLGYAAGSIDSAGDTDIRHFPVVTGNAGGSWRHPAVGSPSSRASDILSPGTPGLTGRRFASIPVELASGRRNSLTVYRTRDAGRHWLPTRPLLAKQGTGWGYYFFDAGDGWVSAGRGMLHTTDGGRHWVLVNHRVGVADVAGMGPAALGEGNFSFVTPRVGFLLDVPPAAAPGGVLVTHDAGVKWRWIRARLMRGRG